MQATQWERAPLEALTRTPYIRALCYPKVSVRNAVSRVKQLKSLGVTELVFVGDSRLGRLGVLGYGTVGIVLGASKDGDVLALKVRRTDANRRNMSEEARILSLVNRLGVGPPMIGHTKDFLLMKLLDHQEIEEWVRSVKGRGRKPLILTLVHSILNQCRTLDIMGVDHGQLSNLRKHVVVADGSPWILDFESASTTRTPRNVTAAAQNLLIGGKVSPIVRKELGLRRTGSIVSVLSEYKRTMSDYQYSKVLEEIGIHVGP